uniref:Uncharacterized protein n=1 Tax=Leptobrachium leishanense TaxID=445787 RepID=A0A8C5M004_9ANUR
CTLTTLHCSKVSFLQCSFVRSMFTAKKFDFSRPNWFRVSLALGTTATLWVLVSLTV